MKVSRLTPLHLLLFGATALMLWLVLHWGWSLGRGGDPAEHELSFAPATGVTPRGESSKRQADTPNQKADRDQMLFALEEFWRRLGPGMPPGEAQKLLEEMTTLLWTGDPTQVGAAIRAFLDSGRDASTGLPFRVGEGSLAMSPSMRVALLDLLERLDFGEAAAYAEVLVGRMENPDEVAVALRTLMHVAEDDPRRQLAITGVDRLLQRGDWKAQPTGGYLEAFDIATETENPVSWKRLLGLTADAEAYEGTQAAAGLAAHTLAVRSPEFRQLIAKRDPSLSISPIIRGQLMARLDPRVPEELEALNTFVRDPAMTQEEAQAFAANFPSQKDLVGFRLVSASSDHVRTMDEAAQIDIQAEVAVRSWDGSSSARFLTPLLSDMQSRIGVHAAQARESL
ncbi:hypothetical protein [Brevifollis gellanilyticus]|uniref:Uncharacterized protein n=1 Tax=Brevifollis gellanilyticus TaxID=748831 RepID=A0A512MDQ7_9BACT|nr:hypothetical protein [Brevifollis gellanilyticus]GEP44870.1 hypothetical protein BGE01nite_41610 [Brevifollis gellanilyticus]